MDARRGHIMIHRTYTLLSLAVLLALAAGPPAAAKPRPSFDCRKAKSDIERQICAVPEYAMLDRDIATFFGKAMKTLSAADGAKLKAGQVKWLAERDQCIDLIHGDPPIFAEVNSCVGDALRKRAKELESVVATGKLPEAAPE
jgi:uncharacterized protein YecT (DUF1311 family)